MLTPQQLLDAAGVSRSAKRRQAARRKVRTMLEAAKKAEGQPEAPKPAARPLPPLGPRYRIIDAGGREVPRETNGEPPFRLFDTYRGQHRPATYANLAQAERAQTLLGNADGFVDETREHGNRPRWFA